MYACKNSKPQSLEETQHKLLTTDRIGSGPRRPLIGIWLNGYLVLHANILLRTSQLRHILKLLASRKTRYPLG